MGVGVAVAAVALGASVVEKHFTLARADGGVDSAFSLEPAELASLVSETERAWHGLGDVRYGPTDQEGKSLIFRRSIYAVAPISKGQIFTTENIRIVRPGDGAPPSLYSRLINRIAPRDFAFGEAIKLEDLI